jgi:hypothetical protein
MAGIRGVKNPMPVKTKTATGVFATHGGGPTFSNQSVLSAALKSDRKGPSSRGGTKPGPSHVKNAGLVNGTSNRKG